MQSIDWSFNTFSFITYELNTGSSRFSDQMNQTLYTNGYVRFKGGSNPVYLHSDN